MKKYSLIAFAAIPMLGMVSCSDKEAAPAAAEAKALNTAEDYMKAVADLMDEAASIVEATTVDNAAEQAKKLAALSPKMQQLQKEVEEKGFADAQPTPEMEQRMDAVGERIGKWIISNAENMEKLDPAFMEALSSFGG